MKTTPDDQINLGMSNYSEAEMTHYIPVLDKVDSFTYRIKISFNPLYFEYSRHYQSTRICL